MNRISKFSRDTESKHELVLYTVFCFIINLTFITSYVPPYSKHCYWLVVWAVSGCGMEQSIIFTPTPIAYVWRWLVPSRLSWERREARWVMGRRKGERRRFSLSFSSFPSPLALLSFLKRDDWGRVSVWRVFQSWKLILRRIVLPYSYEATVKIDMDKSYFNLFSHRYRWMPSEI